MRPPPSPGPPPVRPPPPRLRPRQVVFLVVLAAACLVVLPAMMIGFEQDAVRHAPDAGELGIVFALCWLAGFVLFGGWGLVSVRRTGQPRRRSVLARVGQGLAAVLTIAVLALLRIAGQYPDLAAPVFGLMAGILHSIGVIVLYILWRRDRDRRRAAEPFGRA